VEAFASVIPRHDGGDALRKWRTNKNAARLEVLAALLSNPAACAAVYPATE
jgi:hypothetical protein